MDYGIQSPRTWPSEIVLSWAFREDFTAEVFNAMCAKKVDGGQLLSFTDETLRTGLGIRDTAARENLLNRIESLRMEALSLEYCLALETSKDNRRPFVSLPAATSTPHPNTKHAPTGFMSRVVQKCKRIIGPTKNYNMRGVPPPAFVQATTPAPMAFTESNKEELRASEEDDRKPAASTNPPPIIIECNIRHQTNVREYPMHLESFTVPTQNYNMRGVPPPAVAQATTPTPMAFTESNKEELRASEEDDRKPAASTNPPPIIIECNIRHQTNVREYPMHLESFTVPTQNYNMRGVPPPAVAQATTPTPMAFTESNQEELRASEEDDRKPAASTNPLPILNECNICFETNVRGYQLACDHKQCTSCMSANLQAALNDPSLLPLRCCDIPIDMNVANSLLSETEIQQLQERLLEKESSNHMYCPKCKAFVNLEWVAAINNMSTIVCDCRAVLCVHCKSLEHRGISCSTNIARRTGSDEPLLQLSKKEGWKQCPKCRTMIEKKSGCNHMTCTCKHHFCYKCGSKWNTKKYICSARCR